MGHKEPFEGVVDKVGNCRITSLYITLLRDVSYVFELLGNTCPESEETMI